MKTYYQILGVTPDSGLKEIKSCYRKLVKQYHPDRNIKHTKLFEEITCAYTTLKNADKRKQYDLKLQENHDIKTPRQFHFREFKNWLFKFSFIRTLFGARRVALTPKKGSDSLKNIDTKALIQRIVFSTNIHVQINAVQAILGQGEQHAINDLIRLLYSKISEDVKLKIVEGIKNYDSPRIRQILQEVYEGERSIKLKQRIRHSLAQNPLMN